MTAKGTSVPAGMRALAIIPARGGSTGLPRKHLRSLGGIPVITHTVRAALHSSVIGRVICSTDDASIARVAARAGAEVPFMRPAELATHDAPTIDVILHAVAWVEAGGYIPDIIVTLQPTSPLRTSNEIDEAVRLLEDPSVDSAVSISVLPFPATVVGWLEGGRYRPALRLNDVRRQTSPAAVRVTGGIYVTRRPLLNARRLLGNSPAALIVSDSSAIDVDSLEDLRRARRSLRARGGGC